MECSDSLKEDLEKKIILSVKSIVEQFQFLEGNIPKEILLKNYEGYEIFKEFLERELRSNGYDIPVFMGKNKEGYFIDVGEYIKLDKYP